MAALREKRTVTLDEYELMIQRGELTEWDKVELLEGEIVEMTPIGDRHVFGVTALNKILVIGVGDRGIVMPGGPVRLLPASMPEPDLVILKPHPTGYLGTRPGPDDVLLVIEVADSSLRKDMKRKMPLYGRSGIVESWLFDVVGRELTVHRSPGPDGYADMMTYGREAVVSPLAFPGISIAVADVTP